jgi:hypothetical protein
MPRFHPTRWHHLGANITDAAVGANSSIVVGQPEVRGEHEAALGHVWCSSEVQCGDLTRPRVQPSRDSWPDSRAAQGTEPERCLHRMAWQQQAAVWVERGNGSLKTYLRSPREVDGTVGSMV